MTKGTAIPNTPTKTFRCDDDLWKAAKAKAKAEGKTLTDVLVDALVAYIKAES